MTIDATDAPPGETKPRWRRVARSLLIITTIVVTLAVIAAFVSGLWVQHRLGSQVDTLTSALPVGADRPKATDNESMNILLLGSDKRVDGSIEGQRSDTIMVVNVAADRKSVGVVGIPRDSWVQVPGHGSAKINAAFAWGGPALTVQTVENLTGVRIDHVAVIDWEGFKALTDVLGGVRIKVAKTTTDGYTGRTWKEGRQEMDGETALAYVRQRAGLAGGDFDRIKRQQNFMRALTRKTLTKQTFLDPRQFYKVADAVTRHLSVDEGWTTSQMRDLFWSLRTVGANQVAFTTIPVRGTGMEGDQSVVYLDRQTGEELWDAVRDDVARDWIEENRVGLQARVN